MAVDGAIGVAALLVPLAPLAAFAAVVVGGSLSRRFDLPATLLAAVAAVVSFAASVLLALEIHLHDLDAFVAAEASWIAGSTGDGLSFGLLVDPLSALFASVVGLVGLLVIVFSYHYMNLEGEAGLPRYYASMTLFLGSMQAFVFADNLLMAFVFFELVGFCSYLLIGFWYDRPSAASAAKKAFLVTRFGDYFLLVGVAVVYAGFGTLAFHGPESVFAAAEAALDAGDEVLGLQPSTAVTAVALLLLGGVVGKSAQFPLHDWLPDAMEGPTPVSALIHAATMVAAGVYLVARTYELYALSPTALLVVAYLGGFTALFAATMALVMDDVKQVLAYSTISQYGYVMLALGAGGYTAAVFHLVNHAFFKALLFLGAGSVIVALHHEQDMWRMGGLRRRLPVTYWTFLAGSLALAGVAPFSGFWSKDEALASALTNAANEPLLWIPFAFGLAGVVLTGFYTFRMHALVFHGEPRTDDAREAREGGFTARLPLAVLGVLALASGFVYAVPLGVELLPDYLGSAAYYEAVASGAGYASHVEHSLGLSLGALALALSGAAAGFWLYAGATEPLRSRAPAFTEVLEQRYYVDDVYVWLAEDVSLRTSRMMDAFDADVVDGAVDATSSVSLGSGDALRRMQTGVVTHYVLVFALGLLALVVVFGLVGGWL
ncbi:MAG: NADH-quinone oxidoreductase subunit L [Halobacteriales archaeon]